MRAPRRAARTVVVGVVLSAGSVACAVVAGLEDKQPYDADAAAANGEGGPSTDGAGPSDASTSTIGPIETFATAQNQPWGIAIDDAYVYWTNEGDSTIVRAPKSGGLPVVIARNQAQPHLILVDSTSVIWQNANSANTAKAAAGNDVFEITRLAKANIVQDAAPLQIEGFQNNKRTRSIAFAKNPDNEVWSTWEDKLRRDHRSDQNGGKDIIKGLAPRQPTALAVDDANAYFYLQGPLQVWSVPKTADGVMDAGGPIATLPNAPEVVDMAADGTALYMVTNAGAVLKLPTPDGGAATLLAISHPFPRSVVVDDAYVYFTTTSSDDANGQGAVAMVAKSGSPSVDVASGQNRPRGIAVDVGLDGSHTVYWATYGDGKIQRARVR